jgi:xeroderma pigmentosum group C-complementing protein
MVYVLAFEEDGYARDVTPRYARDYGAKVAKVQGGSKSRKEWWERVMSLVRRPYRLVSALATLHRSNSYAMPREFEA